MKSFVYKIQSKVFEIIGDIKLFKWPMFVVYNARSYGLSGDELYDVTKMVMEDAIQPGDILLRTYDGYLSSKCIPGCFKHAGVYVGNSLWNDGQKRRTVIHSLSEGVIKENVVNFFRTDHLAIVRPRVSQEVRDRAASIALRYVGAPYDYNFDLEGANAEKAIYCSELPYLCYKGAFNFKESTQG